MRIFPPVRACQRWRLSALCILLAVSAATDVGAGAQAGAGEKDENVDVPLLVTLELPRLKVREYHRPYVAVWIEDDSRELVRHVAVWYQQGKNDEGHGQKWLPDLRQWWRRGGRKMDASVDAVSGATRNVGTHVVRVPQDRLTGLRSGDYNVVVEVAREVGGRELVRLPFAWPLSKSGKTQASGKTELGTVTLQLTPAGH